MLIANRDCCQTGYPGVLNVQVPTVKNIIYLCSRSLYGPRDISHILINSNLISDLKKHSEGYDYRIVMGDLNANILSTSSTTLFIKDLACVLNLKLVEHGATNHVGDSHTWIDVILTDDDNVVLSANNLMASFPNSHNIIDVGIDFQSAKPPALNKFMYGDFKSSKSEELFLSLLPVIGRRFQVWIVESNLG